MRASWLSRAAGLIAALAVPLSAAGQTVDVASSFFDQTATNGTTKVIYYFFADLSHYSDSEIIPSKVVTANCVSLVTAGTTVVTIDWSKVVGEKHGDEVIQIIGGVTFAQEGGAARTNQTPGLLIKTFAPEMNTRLLKAVGIITKGCAKPSAGL